VFEWTAIPSEADGIGDRARATGGLGSSVRIMHIRFRDMPLRSDDAWKVFRQHLPLASWQAIQGT